MEGRHSHSLAPGMRVRAVWFGLFDTITLDMGLPRKWREDKDSVTYGILVVTVYSIQNLYVKLFLKQ